MKCNLKETKELLIIVDMVNGFLKEGALADPKMQRIIPEVEKLIQKFLEEKNPILAFRDWHDRDALEFNDYPPHCIGGTEEAELIDELKKYQDRMHLINKNTTSGFVVPGFSEYIHEMINLRQVTAVGVCSDICVKDILIPLKKDFQQKNKQVDILVPENAVDTYDAPNHNREEWNETAFKFMAQAGIKILRKNMEEKKK